MTVQMILILMDTYDILMLRKEFLCICLSDFQNFFRRDLFILMKTDDIVSVHPAGVFIPDLFFPDPCLIYFIIVYGVSVIGPLDKDISLFDLFITKDIFENISHSAVTFC